jgi:hypothetical protein
MAQTGLGHVTFFFLMFKLQLVHLLAASQQTAFPASGRHKREYNRTSNRISWQFDLLNAREEFLIFCAM